jgi:hypothetical protein
MIAAPTVLTTAYTKRAALRRDYQRAAGRQAHCALPNDLPSRWFARLFGSCYARWCTRRMVDDRVARFASPTKLAATRTPSRANRLEKP